MRDAPIIKMRWLLVATLVAEALALLVSGGPAALPSRRRALLGGAATLFIASPSVAADQGLAGRSERAAQERQKVQDPFAAQRGEGRMPFVDELAPLTRDERGQRAAAAGRAASDPRPAAKVSMDASPAALPTAPPTDEVTITFEAGQPLGLTLRDLRVGFEYGTRDGTSRVLVASVAAGGAAAASGRVAIDNIIVAVDGVNVEREDSQQVQARLAALKAETGRTFAVTFRNALAFNEALLVMGTSKAGGGGQVATTIAPRTDTQPAQVLAVRRLEAPEDNLCTRQADNGDLLEIRYAGRLAEGQVFDGMQLAARLADDSIQFVLGKQPAGQFPPAWDLGLMGMCIGERREIDVPPILGFGPKGLPKRGIPPNARLLYEIELLSINADSRP